MNYTGRPWQELAFFVSFALAVWLRPKLEPFLTQYVSNTWLLWLATMLAAYVAARYLFPWLAQKFLGSISK